MESALTSELWPLYILNKEVSSQSGLVTLVFEAVNEDSIFKVQSIIDAFFHYSPVKLLASLIERNEKGETPLVVAMKRKNDVLIDALMKLLFQSGWETFENCKLMCVTAIDQISHQIPIMQLIEYVIIIGHGDCGSTWLDFLAQIFIKSTSITRQDKIIALELIGASLIISGSINSSSSSSLHGLKCWREALTLRYFPAKGEPFLPKRLDVHISFVASNVVFGSSVEVMSMEELNLLEEDFKHNFFSTDDLVRLSCEKRMQTQGLLTIRRTSSQANHDQPYSLYLQKLLQISEYLLVNEIGDDGKYLVNLLLLILEEMTGCDPTILSFKSFKVFIVTLFCMSRFFIKMLKAPPGYPGKEELSYANFLAPTKIIITIPKFLAAFDTSMDLSKLVFRFLYVLESISTRLTNQEKHQLEEYYFNFIRNFFPSERTTTVLHAAVKDFRWWFLEEYEMGKTVQLILKLGADPNAIDENGETALHILAKHLHDFSESDAFAFQALVDAGGHLDITDDNGHTVICALENNCSFDVVPSIGIVFPLSCYSARAILRHGIRYDEDRLPLHLQTFVSEFVSCRSAECIWRIYLESIDVSANFN